MKTRRFLILCLGLFGANLFGHEQVVHQAITVNAAESAFADSQAYTNFVNVISSDLIYTGLGGATNAMVDGSFQEDNGPQEEKFGGYPSGGYRSLNHFYDPLDAKYNKGLSDVPPDRRDIAGTNSFAWASISNCAGFNYSGAFYVFGRNKNTTNIWSWRNARGYEWLGLAATNKSERQTNLLSMFRAVGQVMHLLEDTSQPQHVRNEQHLDRFESWHSPIEIFGKDQFNKLNYQHGMLDWRADGFTRLEDFWDRHLYNGSAAALNADLSGGASTLGLAEWCNGNFLGARHTYAEYFTPGTISYYPFPSLEHSTDFRVKAGIGAGVRVSYLKNGKEINRYFVTKKADGITVTNHSALLYLGTGAIGRSIKVTKVSSTIRDPVVLQNYHDILIPKAVKYSAGLLDYYFRGQINACIVGGTDAGTLGLFIENKSGTNLYGGAFYLFAEDAAGVRTPILTNDFTGSSLDDMAFTNIVFTPPSTLPTAFVVVYQGTIGADDTTPLDPVDANIAIAAKRIIPKYPDTDGPTPDSLIYPDPADLGTANVTMQHGAISYFTFGDFGPGQYQVSYVDGYYSSIIDEDNTAYWTINVFDQNGYGSDVEVKYIDWTSLYNGTEYDSDGYEAITKGYQANFTFPTTSEVADYVSALNPMTEKFVHMGNGPIEMMSGGTDPYPFISFDADGAVTYQLHRIATAYPQPSRIRISNYADEVKPLLTISTNCLNATSQTEWDGSFSYRELADTDYAWWYTDDDYGYNLAINGKQVDSIYVGYTTVKLPDGSGRVPGWQIWVWGNTNGRDQLIWSGYKLTGTNPVGTYFRDFTMPMCADGLCCFSLESY